MRNWLSRFRYQCREPKEIRSGFLINNFVAPLFDPHYQDERNAVLTKLIHDIHVEVEGRKTLAARVIEERDF